MAISHADHNHPATPAARAACRKAMATGTSLVVCTHGPSCPIHTTCDGGCPPVGQVVIKGTVRLVGVAPRKTRAARTNGAPVAARRRFIRDESDMADIPHVFSAAIRHAWHQDGWSVQYGDPYNNTEKRIVIDNGHDDRLVLVYKAGQHHVNAVFYHPAKVTTDRQRGIKVGEAPHVSNGLRMLHDRATITGGMTTPMN